MCGHIIYPEAQTLAKKQFSFKLFCYAVVTV